MFVGYKQTFRDFLTTDVQYIALFYARCFFLNSISSRIKSVAHNTSLIYLFTATCFGYNRDPSSGLL